ncbi:hypothetical protein Q9R32_17380 [Actinotalea sp. AC32]|nr:hypothetical protein [Actinotalea sp. AC32]
MTTSVEHPEHRPRRWDDLTDRQKTGVLVAASVQLALAATAWTDLWFRPAAQVRGSKPVWAAVIAVNWVGPVLYLWRGIQHRVPAIP